MEALASSRLTTTPRLRPREGAIPAATSCRRPLGRRSASTAHVLVVPTSRPAMSCSRAMGNPEPGEMCRQDLLRRTDEEKSNGDYRADPYHRQCGFLTRLLLRVLEPRTRWTTALG